MKRVSCLAILFAFIAVFCLIAVDTEASTIAQNSAWNVTRSGATQTLRFVAYGDSIYAGYISATKISRRAGPHNAAEYAAAKWGQNVEVRRRCQSGAVAKGVYDRIVKDRSYMQTTNTRLVTFEMCGNDYLQARSSFKGQTGTCNYSVLTNALSNCRYYTEQAIKYINSNAHSNTQVKIVGNLYYPGYNADNVLTKCNDPVTGQPINCRAKFLPLLVESNWETCNLAHQYGWVCADNFAEYMAADYDSNGDGVIDTETIRYVPGESKSSYTNRIMNAYAAGLLKDSRTTKMISPSASVNYLLSDDTHPTYLGATAGTLFTTPGGNVTVYHSTPGAYPGGKNPSWNLNGHDRMGWRLSIPVPNSP